MQEIDDSINNERSRSRWSLGDVPDVASDLKTFGTCMPETLQLVNSHQCQVSTLLRMQYTILLTLRSNRPSKAYTHLVATLYSSSA